jgi:gluconolactonase
LSVLLDNIPSPNGLVLNREQTELYLGVTRDNSIWRVPLLADGGVSKVGRFIQMSGGQGPDGLAIDSAGNIIVAHVGLGCVWAFNPLGEPVLRIDSCAGIATTNIAFGGTGGNTLFITEAESGSVMMATLDTPGQPIFSHY